MGTKFGQEFHLFGILAILVIIVIEHLSRQTTSAQFISAGLLILVTVAYIITIHELERNE